ncbi:beta strand repeat-containing protein, partial [Phascolarctobacterium faecium]
MSKREIRAKRLVAAVLLAISVQMWSAPPLWAAEASVQTETSAAGEAKETKDAKDAKAADSETGGEADAGEEETVVVPVIGYSTRSAAGSDYGVMPLADTAVDGALTGVTSINDAKFYADTHDLLLGYDAKSQGTGTVALGSDANAGGQYSTAIGASASATAENSSALGMYARAGFKDSVAIGFSSNATADNMVSFGVTENGGSTWTTRRSLEGIANIDMEGTINLGGTWTKNASGIYESNGKGELTGITKINGIDFQYIEDSPSLAIGTYLSGDYSYSLAIGGGADAAANNATAVGFSTSAYGENSTAIGNSSTVYEKSGTAIGASAYVQNGHTGSVAIGYDSATTAANQVAFGTGTVTTDDGPEVVTWTNRRSLAGISDIDMEGALTGVTSINGNVLVPMNEDVTNKSLAIGTGAAFTSRYSSETICKNAIVIGNGTSVAGDGALAIGYYANQREGSFAGGIGSIAINGWVSDGNYSVAINGFVAEADNVVAIGYRASSDSNNGVAIGSNAYASYDGTALGYAAQGNDNNAVAIGAYSGTTEENQVSFGHKAGDTNYADYSKFTDDLFRSLTNVADIEMHGALTGVTGIDGVTVSGTDASTGLTVGGNAVIGKTDTPFSSTGFAVAKDGAVTAKTVNGATITGTGFNGVTLSTDGKVNGAAITSNSFNGVKLEKGADSHYKVGGVDVTKMQTDVAGKADAATVTALDTRVGKSETDIGTLKTTVGDSSKGLVKDTADLKAAVGDSSKGLVKQVSDVDTAYKAADTVLQGRAKTLEDKTAGISRSGSTTTLETNTSVSSSGITTNKATVSGATATTLENGKLTVGAATVQNTGFAVGSSSLNNGSLTVDGNNKLTTAGLTASKVTVGAVTVSGGKVSGLTDAALSAVSTEAVTGKQLNATNTTVSALDTAYKAADTQIRTDFAAADTTLQNNIDAKVAQTAYDTKMS